MYFDFSLANSTDKILQTRTNLVKVSETELGVEEQLAVDVLKHQVGADSA